MTDSIKAPQNIDSATGLPQRHLAEAISINPDPKRAEAARLLSIEIARSLFGDKCEDVAILDLRGQSQITDFMVIASGTSERQIRSAGFHVEELAKERDFQPFRDNLKAEATGWVFLDLVDVVVHLFEPEVRAHYDLEMLWGDAPRVGWGDSKNEAALDRNRAGLRPGEVLPGSSLN